MAGTDDERFARSQDLVPIPHVASSRVVVVGAGSMGAPVSYALVSEGVATQAPGRFDAFDADIVKKRNLNSTPFFEEHFGLPKPEAFADTCQRKNSRARVHPHNEMVTTKNLDRVLELCEGASLLFLAADDTSGITPLLADEAHPLCPVLWAEFHEYALSADVAFSLPTTRPLGSMIAHHHGRRRIDEPQALATNTHAIALFVAQVALALLLVGEKSTGLSIPIYADATFFSIALSQNHQYVFRGVPGDVIQAVRLLGTDATLSS